MGRSSRPWLVGRIGGRIRLSGARYAACGGDRGCRFARRLALDLIVPQIGLMLYVLPPLNCVAWYSYVAGNSSDPGILLSCESIIVMMCMGLSWRRMGRGVIPRRRHARPHHSTGPTSGLIS